MLQKIYLSVENRGRMVIGVRGRLFFEYIVVFQINCGVSLAEGLEGVTHGLGVGVAELAAEGDGGVLVDKVLEMDNILRGELAATEQ